MGLSALEWLYRIPGDEAYKLLWAALEMRRMEAGQKANRRESDIWPDDTPTPPKDQAEKIDRTIENLRELKARSRGVANG